jgi:hypothetical protein
VGNHRVRGLSQGESEGVAGGRGRAWPKGGYLPGELTLLLAGCVRARAGALTRRWLWHRVNRITPTGL